RLTPESVATPFESVAALPTPEPFNVKLIVFPLRPEPPDVRVAVRVAVPPNVPLPDTAEIAVGDGSLSRMVNVANDGTPAVAPNGTTISESVSLGSSTASSTIGKLTLLFAESPAAHVANRSPLMRVIPLLLTPL